ncbi:hypothetical protein BH20GEM1_BH20GEM1_13820 [soil metagenome]
MRTIARYRFALVREVGTAVPPRANLSSPRGVFRFMQTFLADANREQFVVLCVNTRNDFLGYNIVSVGSLNALMSSYVRYLTIGVRLLFIWFPILES